MTRAQIKRCIQSFDFKTCRAKVPMIVTNHTYDVIGSMFPQKEMGGGSGFEVCRLINYLSFKKKRKRGRKLSEILYTVRTLRVD